MTAGSRPPSKARSARPKRAKGASAKPNQSRWQRTGVLSEHQRAKLPNGLEPPRDPPERDPVRPPIPRGARVRLTGAFLRNTGQIAGGEGQKVWKVIDRACELCKLGRHVAVNERRGNDYEGDDLYKSWRHIAIANLEDLEQLARAEKVGREKLLVYEEQWKRALDYADRHKARMLKRHGRDSLQYQDACRRLDFLNVTRARADSDRAYIEATGKEPWYFSDPSPLDRIRIIYKGSMPEPTGIDEMPKESECPKNFKR